MAKPKGYTAEQIIMKLREAEVLLSQGQTVKQVCRGLEVSEQTYYHWRREYGGIEHDPGEETEGIGKRECQAEEAGGRCLPGQCDPEGGVVKKVISPAMRRQAGEQAQQVLGVSERRVCRVLDQPRSTQRYDKNIPDDEEILRTRIIALASQYGRYDYRRVKALLSLEGWRVNHKRVERIWRQEGLKVPPKQPKRGRLWLNNGSIVRLRPRFPMHVWSYDFVQDHTQDGNPFRILNVIDEYTRECLAVKVARSLTHKDVLEVLARLFCERGVPVHLRSDNGSEFTAKKVRAWLSRLEVKPLFIEPGSP